jgi:hypothetical protein
MKKPKMSFKICCAFSIFIVMSMFTSNINIEKSFAVENVALLPLISSDPKLNIEMNNFYDCIKKSATSPDSSYLPNFFNNEPTKTEIALCYKEMQASK